MPAQTYESIEWQFVGNDSALNAAFQRAEASSKSHVSKVNTHLKGIGSSINVNEHFVSSTKNVEKEAQAHVGRLNSIFKHAGAGIKETLGGIASGAMSVFGGTLITGAFQKIEQTTEKLLEMGMEHQSVWIGALKRMTAFTGSAERADEILTHLHHLAVDRALEFQPLADAAFKLTEIGYKGPEIVNMFKGITAQAVALGKGSEGVQRLVGMLQMMEDSGKAAGRGLMQLERQGYQIFATLEKVTGLSRTFLRDALQKGKLDPRAVIGMLTGGWEQQFGGLAEKLSHGYKDEMVRFAEMAAEPLATITTPLTKAAKHTIVDLQQIFTQVGPGLAEGLSTGLDYAAGALTKGLDYLITLTGIKLANPALDKAAEDAGRRVGSGFDKGLKQTPPQAVSGLHFLQSPQKQFVQGGNPNSSLLQQLEQVLNDPNLQKFWQGLMAKGFEGTQGQDVAYGGKAYDKSQGMKGVPGSRGPDGRMTHAFGPWQEEPATFKEAANALGLDPNDISLHNQQLVATYLLYKQKALDAILQGKFAEAVPLLTGRWTSLPGGSQSHGNTMSKFLNATEGSGASTNWTQGGGTSQVDPASQRSAQREARIKEIEAKSAQAVELMGTLFDRINMLRRELGYQEVNANAPVGLSGAVHAPEPGVYPRAFAPDSPEAKLRQTTERTLTAIETDYTQQLRINRDNLIELGKLHRQRQAEEKRILDAQNAQANIGVGTKFFGRLGAYGDTTPYQEPASDKDLPPQVKLALENYAAKFGGFQETTRTIPPPLTEMQKAVQEAGKDPGKFRRDAITSVKPLEGAGKVAIEKDSLLLFAALGKVQRSAIDLSDAQEEAFSKAMMRLPLNEEERKSLDAVILANKELNKGQKQALADGLDKHALSKEELVQLNALIFKYDDLRKVITEGLTQQVMEGSQNIAGAEKNAVVDLPKNLAAVATEFITKWDFTGKSAMQILTGGLKSVIVEPMGKIFQEIVQKWIAQQLSNLLGDKVMHTSKLASEAALIAAINANTLAHGGGAASSSAGGILSAIGKALGIGIGAVGGGAPTGVHTGIPGIGTIFGPHGYASGLDYVPYDNFPAMLHKGEAVVPASENRGGKGGNTTIHITQNLYAPVVSGSSYSHPRSRREMLEMFQPAMLAAFGE